MSEAELVRYTEWVLATIDRCGIMRERMKRTLPGGNVDAEALVRAYMNRATVPIESLAP